MAFIDDAALAMLREESLRRGYRFETSDDGRVVRMIRPDGSIAVQASAPRRPSRFLCARCACTWAGGREEHVCPEPMPEHEVQ